MGVVYDATDPHLDRRVALKTIRMASLEPGLAEEFAARFHTEALAVARLQHANIISIFDVGRDADTPFLVMELIKGTDLKRELDINKNISGVRVFEIARQLLSALTFAHKRGIVHRDIKPANILLDEHNNLKLGDFGAARIVDSNDATKTRGFVIGTPRYMSPEQIQGQAVDARSDIFSCGVLLYQLFSGVRPFDGATDYQITHRVLFEEPAPLDCVKLNLPTQLNEILSKSLAKDRAHRFQSAEEFSASLQTTSMLPVVFAATSGTAHPSHLSSHSTDTRHEERRISVGSSTVTNPRVPPLSHDDAVLHEVELVYWKDISSSSDPSDYVDFLQRFPFGVYAELARRRIARATASALAQESGDNAVKTRADGGGSVTFVIGSEGLHKRAQSSASNYVVSARSSSETLNNFAPDPAWMSSTGNLTSPDRKSESARQADLQRLEHEIAAEVTKRAELAREREGCEATAALQAEHQRLQEERVADEARRTEEATVLRAKETDAEAERPIERRRADQQRTTEEFRRAEGAQVRRAHEAETGRPAEHRPVKQEPEPEQARHAGQAQQEREAAAAQHAEQERAEHERALEAARSAAEARAQQEREAEIVCQAQPQRPECERTANVAKHEEKPRVREEPESDAARQAEQQRFEQIRAAEESRRAGESWGSRVLGAGAARQSDDHRLVAKPDPENHWRAVEGSARQERKADETSAAGNWHVPRRETDDTLSVGLAQRCNTQETSSQQSVQGRVPQNGAQQTSTGSAQVLVFDRLAERHGRDDADHAGDKIARQVGVKPGRLLLWLGCATFVSTAGYVALSVKKQEADQQVASVPDVRKADADDGHNKTPAVSEYPTITDFGRPTKAETTNTETITPAPIPSKEIEIRSPESSDRPQTYKPNDSVSRQVTSARGPKSFGPLASPTASGSVRMADNQINSSKREERAADQRRALIVAPAATPASGGLATTSTTPKLLKTESAQGRIETTASAESDPRSIRSTNESSARIPVAPEVNSRVQNSGAISSIEPTRIEQDKSELQENQEPLKHNAPSKSVEEIYNEARTEERQGNIDRALSLYRIAADRQHAPSAKRISELKKDKNQADEDALGVSKSVNRDSNRPTRRLTPSW